MRQEALSQPTAAAGRCMMVPHASRLREALSSQTASPVGAPQRTSCAARVTGTHVRREDVGGDHDDRCARLPGTIGKDLEKVCEPSCHRAGRSRARELALGETNTAYRAWKCTNRITSRREQLRGLFRFPPLPARDFSQERPDACAVTYLRAQSTGHGRRRACEASLATSPGGQL